MPEVAETENAAIGAAGGVDPTTVTDAMFDPADSPAEL